MYKYVLCTALVVFVVYEFGIQEVSSLKKHDQLEFWKRDPKYQTKRNGQPLYNYGNYNKANKTHKANKGYKASKVYNYRRRYHIPRHELQKILGPKYDLNEANEAIDAFFNNLDGFSKVKHPALVKLQSMISNDELASLHEKLVPNDESQLTATSSADEPVVNYRRLRKIHSHGPHHRPKARGPSLPAYDNLRTARHQVRLVAADNETTTNMAADADTTTNMAADADTTTNMAADSETTAYMAADAETTAYKPVTKAEKIELSPYSLKQQLEMYLVKKFSDVNITVEVLGRTVEYNDIVMLKCMKLKNKYFRADNTKFEEEPEEKKVVFIVHGLTVMGYNQLPCMRTMSSFLKLVGFYFDHLDKFDIYLIPMANPDGVAAAKAKFFWNKNMSPQTACPGIALDRNFDVAWNDSHPEASSCSQQYAGISPFSEPETQAIRDVFHKYSHKIFGYFHVHAGTFGASIFKGDAVLYPKGYADFSPDEDKYVDIRGDVDESMKNANFKVFSVTVETMHNWYGKVTGTSVDYASTVYGVPYAMELVMQLYEDNMMIDATEERETNSVLTEVWKRVLVVIFQNMYTNMQKGE